MFFRVILRKWSFVRHALYLSSFIHDIYLTLAFMFSRMLLHISRRIKNKTITIIHNNLYELKDTSFVAKIDAFRWNIHNLFTLKSIHLIHRWRQVIAQTVSRMLILCLILRLCNNTSTSRNNQASLDLCFRNWWHVLNLVEWWTSKNHSNGRGTWDALHFFSMRKRDVTVAQLLSVQSNASSNSNNF